MMENEISETVDLASSAVGELQEVVDVVKADPEAQVVVSFEEPKVAARRKETKPRVRLTEEQAAEVISLYANGKGLSQKALAEKFNVTQGAISHIVTGKRWAKLQPVVVEPEAVESEAVTTEEKTDV